MANKKDYQQNRLNSSNEILTIANGSNVSDSIDLHGTFLIGFMTPSAMTSTKLHFQGSIDNSNFYDIIDVSAGSKKEINIATAEVQAFSLVDTAHTKSFPFIRIKTASSETAQRKIQLILSPK